MQKIKKRLVPEKNILILILSLFILVVALTSVSHKILEKKAVEKEFFAPPQGIKIEHPSLSGFINFHPSITEEQARKDLIKHEKMMPVEESEIKGYIIELKEKPLLAKELEAKEAKKAIMAISRDVANQKEKIRQEHEKIKDDIKNILGKSRLAVASGKTLSAAAENSLNILNEYDTVFNGIALDITSEQAEKIKKLDIVKNVYPNYEVFALLDESVPVIKADQARTLFGLTGEGVTIAVIDTGIDASHESLDDLDDNNLTNDPKVIGWKDYINFIATPYDDMGHGTHCSGIAAGTGGGTPYIGVAPQAKLVGVKVLDEDGSGYFSTVIAGIEWVAQNKDIYNISIISMSLGASINSDGTTPVEIAADLAVDYGINFVAAAGNSGSDDHTVGIPACANKIIAVGAIDNNMDIAYFSSRGPTLDGRIKPEVSAPGVSVMSSVPTGDCDLCDSSGWMHLSGTSMATPHVAGMVALLLQKNSSMTPAEIRNLLMETSTDRGIPGPDNDYGYGVVNAINALIEISPPAHEVTVENLDIPSWIELGNQGQLKAVLSNKGLNNEQVTYHFFVNGTQVNSGTISISSKNSAEVSYTWLPSIAGDYNVNITIDNIPDEFITTNNYQSDTIKAVDVAGTIKAVVVDSWGNYYTQYTILDELENNWYLYGDYIIDIDYTTLAKDGITYSDIAATNADVLILSDAWDKNSGVTGKNMEFTDAEINAIKQYVEEGHGIIGTSGTLSNDYVPNNMKLAPLFGLTESTEASWSYDFNGEFDLLVEDDVLTKNIEDPYESDQDMTVAFLEINNSLPVTLVAESKSNSNSYEDAFVSAYKLLKGASVYFTHIVEYYIANDQDKQFLYNSLLWTKESAAEQQHDIAAYNLKTNSSVFVLGQIVQINATVRNIGKSNENDIIISFVVNDNVVDTNALSSLSINNESQVTFLWNPSETGEKNIKIRVNQVSGENVLLNNQVGKSIIVAGAYFTDNYYDFGIDTNNDSMYNYLNITSTIDVKQSGYYMVNLCLYTSIFGSLVACADESNNFNIGLNNISVLVNGIDIRKIELNGPYNLKELYLYDNDGNLIDEKNNIYNTSAYSSDDFQAMADLTGEIGYLAQNPIVNQTTNIPVTISNIGYGVDAINTTASLYEYGYSDGINWVQNTTLIGTKDLGNLSTGIELEENFSWTPDKFGEYELMLVVNATNDLEQDNDIDYNWFEVISNAPDVAGYIDYMPNLLVNQSNTITAQVTGKGAMTAQDVTASLFEKRLNEDNPTLIDQINVGTIESGMEQQLTFNWIPNKTGPYYINLSVNCIDDSNPNNNAEYIQTKVITDNPDSILYWWADSNWTINQVKSINLNVENRGTKTATNLNFIIYDFSEPSFLYLNINQTEQTDFNGTVYNVTAQYLDIDNALIDLSYDSNNEQLSLLVNQVVKLNNDVFLALSQVDNESAGIFLGRTDSTTNILTGTINSSDYKSYSVNFTPAKAFNHMLILFLNASADADWSDNYRRTDFYINPECTNDDDCNPWEYCDNGVCICVPNLVNSSWSDWTNITCLINDKMNQTRTKIQYDSNNCGGSNITFVEYNTSAVCNYCSYNVINSSWGAWQNQGNCLTNNSQLQNKSRIEYDSNYNSCYLATHLPTDLWNSGNNNTYWEYNYTGCDYCTPNWVAVNSICNVSDRLTQYHNDANNCYAQTGLSSDNNPPANQTLTCNYCTENIQGPFNTSCMPNNTLTTYWVDNNYASCCLITNLNSDCTINNSGYNNFTQSCVYSQTPGPSGSGGGGGSACKSSWACDPWTKCKNEKQTRVCTDRNRCRPSTNVPATSQSCLCEEDWLCSDWNPKVCDETRKQTRDCEDLNRCVTYYNQPATSKICEYGEVEVIPLSKQPEIIRKIICNYDKTCNYDETPSTCPNDCKRSYKDTLIVGIITVLALALLSGFFVFERKYYNVYSIPTKIKKEVVDLVNMGKGPNEINSYLSFKGFKKKEIEKSIKYADNFRLLKRYVEASIDKGYGIEAIKKVIRESKWPSEIVNDVFNNLKEEK